VEDFGFGDFGAEVVKDYLVLHWSEMIQKRFLILFMPLTIKLTKIDE
jgi:hypothetical protein